MGAHLTSLHDQSEEEAVNGQVFSFHRNVDYAIGLQLVNGSSWQWTDGSALTYTPWAVYEPQDTDTKKCVKVITSVRPRDKAHYGKWATTSCTEKSGQPAAVCKKPENPAFTEFMRAKKQQISNWW
jgi:hypothetical protein